MKQIKISYNTQTFFSTSKVFFFVLLIWAISLFLRLNAYDPEVPIFMDSLASFSYAVDTMVLGGLPENYTVTKPGWPIFLTALFSIFDFEQTSSYMQLQKISGIIFSSLAIFPLYYLCNRFVDKKYSIIPVALFAFAPQLIENSLYGTSYSLFILFFISTIFLFLSNSKKLIFCSFFLAGITTIIRPEGIFLFFSMAVMLIFKFRKEHFKIPKYLFALFLFFLVLLPVIIHAEEIHPGQSIFSRIIHTSDRYLETSVEETNQTLASEGSNDISILTGLTTLPVYLGWAMLPMFIITAPLGFILFFKKLTYDKITIITISIICSLPALYAYSYPLQETKYVYLLFPLFCIFSISPIKIFLDRFTKKNSIIIIILIILVLTSILFYNYKIDTTYDKEYLLVAKKIVENNMIVNDYYPESYYISGLDLDENWSDFKSFHENIDRTNPDGYPYSTEYYLPHKSTPISLINEFGVDDSDKFDSLESFIFEHDEQLTHIIADSIDHRPQFIKDVFLNEHNYSYLIKEWDSKNDGFKNHVKIFRIDYELLNLKINNEQLP